MMNHGQFLRPAGDTEVEVPDTLDLADRAKFGINALAGLIMPRFDHECLWLLNVLSPSAYPHTNQWFDHNPRTLWALTLLRIMTGSQHGLELEQKMLASMLERVTDDGLYLNPKLDRRGAWWRLGGAGGRFSSVCKDGLRMMNPGADPTVRETADGLQTPGLDRAVEDNGSNPYGWTRL